MSTMGEQIEIPIYKYYFMVAFLTQNIRIASHIWLTVVIL